jgi:hypothetical protein
MFRERKAETKKYRKRGRGFPSLWKREAGRDLTNLGISGKFRSEGQKYHISDA